MIEFKGQAAHETEASSHAATAVASQHLPMGAMVELLGQGVAPKDMHARATSVHVTGPADLSVQAAKAQFTSKELADPTNLTTCGASPNPKHSIA